MLDHLFSPRTATNEEVYQVLELQQLAQAFRHEVVERQAFENYCQWYDETAQQNKADLATMQSEINLFGYFYRQRS
jgi:hypothetical protein